MSFTVLQNGVDAMDADVMMANLSGIVYAILYNRMEHDTSNLSQIMPNMMSDYFYDNSGKYNTVCVADTTSYFCTDNYYTNACTYLNPGSVYSECHSDNTCGTYWFCFGNFYACVNIQSTNIPNCLYGYTCMNDTSFYICDYDYIKMDNTVSYHAYFEESGTYVCYNNNIYGIINCGYYPSGSDGSWTNHFEFCRIGISNCYSFFCNSTLICCMSGNIPATLCLYSYARSYNHCAWMYNTLSISAVNHCNTSLSTNIKNYATPKNTVMLVTNSCIPEGNCIRYDIKNQSGNIYLCDACPDKLYALTSNDSCCFYAVIKQCIECCLCNPQCICRYALMFM